MIVRTFRPLLYREGIGRVTSPPFDIIGEENGTKLLENPYNIMNLMPGSSNKDPFITIQEWLEKGIISRQNESLILLKQIINTGKDTKERFGVIGLLDLRNDENRLKIHENVIPGYVEERKEMIRTMDAQIEPVFIVTDSRKLHDILAGISSELGCTRSYEEPDGIWNSICVVEDREKISVIMNELRGKTGIIADGHHRTKAMSELSEEKGANELCFNNLLVYVTSIWDNATEIGPVHRIVKKWPGFLEDVKSVFDVHDHSTDSQICLMCEGRIYSLKHKQAGKHAADSFMVNDLFGIAREKGYDPEVTYWPFREAAIKHMNGRKDLACILMPPFEKDQFISIVENGMTLPPKSTYFYPKIPSGITFYPMWPEMCHCSSAGRAADS